jgi:hypothetical protein
MCFAQQRYDPVQRLRLFYDRNIADYLRAFLILRRFSELHNRNKMENIQNTRGKGYFLLYLFMFLFFLISLLLMLYNRSGVLEFPVK